MNQLVAIIDDEQDIAELVAVNLKKEGFRTKEFEEGKPFFVWLKKQLPDLVILDLMLPDISGLDICRELKKDPRYSGIPVIMLTAKKDEFDKILGLELGADDYVTKPFSPRELTARVKVILRRNETKTSEKAIVIGDILSLNIEKFEVCVENKKIGLTTTEFKILKLLISKPGNVFTRDQILNSLWGEDKIVIDRTVDVHVKNLRDKLGRAGKFIKNIRGIGYKLDA